MRLEHPKHVKCHSIGPHVGFDPISLPTNKHAPCLKRYCSISTSQNSIKWPRDVVFLIFICAFGFFLSLDFHSSIRLKSWVAMVVVANMKFSSDLDGQMELFYSFWPKMDAIYDQQVQKNICHAIVESPFREKLTLK